MRIAAPVGQPAVPYLMTQITVDGITTREIECLHTGCGDSIDGSDHWAFGVVTEPAHIAALRACMADRCGLRACPNRYTFLYGWPNDGRSSVPGETEG